MLSCASLVTLDEPLDAARRDRSLSNIAWIAKLLVSIVLVWWLLTSVSFAR
jgi:hypothetical protein